ncbi:ferrous iron transport protein B [Parabacteroides sp. FAFU027]|uniref:ferrous iron transport protein B n=1 Tax=Parabacteroides sp. FAFU027 TaxID=2922715 RepID=UPI001FAFA0C2|nr:ferrous iron transport protein B [Parabacteroides sp. FAFU027]
MEDQLIISQYLSELRTGEECVITKVMGHGAFRRRITEMGFVKGKKVKVIKNAPLQDPVEYEIMGYHVSLRRSEAKLIEVVLVDDSENIGKSIYSGTFALEAMRKIQEKTKVINVALVGNPNCGKTSLFNYASGSHEKVGNYSGVTVDAKSAVLQLKGYTINIVDLPGTYSITEYTPEELYVREHIFNEMPDVVVNVVDASNLERNLFLTTQLIDMHVKVVMALNMYDELERSGAQFDYDYLGKMIGIPIIPTVAAKGRGIDDLFTRVIEAFEDKDPVVRHVHINYGEEIEGAIKKIQDEIWKNKEITDKYSSRFLSIKLLENDRIFRHMIDELPNGKKIQELVAKEIHRLEKMYKEPADTVITDAKYGFVAGAINETLTPAVEEKRRRTSDLDNLLTHKILGFPIFIFFMWVMFQATFTLGSYPMGWIDAGVTWFSNSVSSWMSEGSLRDLIVNGIIGGVGGVIIFLPNILLLFFFISLMEDTGYMARSAFIMDKLMHKIGLHGKSFIPLLMGFGCNVPAVMATRTLQSKKDRLLTMLITPFMSCSARLPVYVLLIGAFFPKNQGLVLFSIYVIGVLTAIVAATVLKKTFFSKREEPFVMELPPYRVPTLKNTTVHMWHKAVQYLKKMGTVILTASILIWALSYFPKNITFSKNYDALSAQVANTAGLTKVQKEAKVSEIELQKEAERQEKSYIGQIGHAIEPVIRPLGFDWKIGVSLVTGLAAKEIVVSTMGILYQADKNAGETSGHLKKKLIEQVHNTGDHIGERVFNPLVAYGMMIFILIYFPCIAVIAAIRKEAGWGWASFAMVYTTATAWIMSFIIYQVGSLFI